MLCSIAYFFAWNPDIVDIVSSYNQMRPGNSSFQTNLVLQLNWNNKGMQCLKSVYYDHSQTIILCQDLRIAPADIDHGGAEGSLGFALPPQTTHAGTEETHWCR